MPKGKTMQETAIPKPEPGPSPRLVRLSGLLEEWEADAAAAAEARANQVPRGPITGLPKVDQALGGCLAPGVSIVHGTPGIGKTAFALQTAAECGCPALFVSCEMPALELLRRVTARVTGTFLGKLKTGELHPAESLALARRAVAAAPDVALLDATAGAVPPGSDPAGRPWTAATYIRECAAATRGDSRHLLIVVDSVHSWAEAVTPSLPEYEALNAALAALRTLAGELRCPVLAVAERNRASMERGGLSAGAGSRKIEYGAEAVIDLSKDGDEGENAVGEVKIALTLAKNRHGTLGKKIPLLWTGRLQKFSEV